MLTITLLRLFIFDLHLLFASLIFMINEYLFMIEYNTNNRVITGFVPGFWSV